MLLFGCALSVLAGLSGCAASRDSAPAPSEAVGGAPDAAAPPAEPPARAPEAPSAAAPTAEPLGDAPEAPEEADDPTEAEAKGDGLYILKGDYYRSYAENTWRILTGPLRYDRDDWLLVGLLAGATGAFLALDETIDDFWQEKLRGNASDSASDVLRQFGGADVLFAASLGGYALAEAFAWEREKATFLLMLESVILGGALTGGIKLLTGRVRPHSADGAFDWEGPLGGGDIDSAFPSGHTAKAFAAAAVVADTYGEEHPWVPWVAYSLAAGTGLSRINDEEHWASGVFLGGALGLLVGKMVVRYSPFLAEQGVSIRPFRDGGVAVSFRF